MRVENSTYRVFFENSQADLLVREVLQTIPDIEELDVSAPFHTARFRTSLQNRNQVKHLLRQLNIISIMIIGKVR